jgi:hypothetical protein
MQYTAGTTAIATTQTSTSSNKLAMVRSAIDKVAFVEAVNDA